MAKLWKCRLVGLNDDPLFEPLPWTSFIEAHNAQRAAVVYCNRPDVWECANWDNGFGAIVEVSEHGETGVHRMEITAYHSLEFSATPADLG